MYQQPYYPYNYQYVQSKDDVHTKLPKEVEKAAKKEAKKKKKSAVKKPTNLAQTNQLPELS